MTVASPARRRSAGRGASGRSRERLDRAYEKTTLPDKPANLGEIDRFLVDARKTGLRP